MILVWNVPDELHRRLTSQAERAGMSLSEYLLAEIRRVAEVPTPDEMWARLQDGERVDLGEGAMEALRAEREGR